MPRRLLQHRAAMRGAIGAAVDRADDGRELALEELIERRGRIAHDVAVERPQRLGDLRPIGIELQRIRQEAHALLVGIEHRLEPRVEVLFLHVGNEGLGFDRTRGSAVAGGHRLISCVAWLLFHKIIFELHLAPVLRPGTFEIVRVVARLARSRRCPSCRRCATDTGLRAAWRTGRRASRACSAR